MAVLGAGILGAELFLTRVSLLGVARGHVLFLFGWRAPPHPRLPARVPAADDPDPGDHLQPDRLPAAAARIARSARSPSSRSASPCCAKGNVITLANTTLEVAEACSGIRSLVSLLTLAIVYGYFVEPRPWARVALALASVPVAIVANGVRVAGTGIAAHYFGAEAAAGLPPHVLRLAGLHRRVHPAVRRPDAHRARRPDPRGGPVRQSRRSPDRPTSQAIVNRSDKSPSRQIQEPLARASCRARAVAVIAASLLVVAAAGIARASRTPSRRRPASRSTASPCRWARGRASRPAASTSRR